MNELFPESSRIYVNNAISELEANGDRYEAAKLHMELVRTNLLVLQTENMLEAIALAREKLG